MQLAGVDSVVEVCALTSAVRCQTGCRVACCIFSLFCTKWKNERM